MKTIETMEGDVRSWYEKFKDNLHRAWAYATAWVTAVWAGVFTWWSSLDKSEQVAMVGTYIAANKVPFIIGFGTIVSYIIAKGWPQPKLAAKIEEKKIETAVQAANQIYSAEAARNGVDTQPNIKG